MIRFILSLASSDLLLSLSTMPLAISKLLNHCMWSHGVELCKAFCTFDVVFCSASIYSLIAISLDRFYAVHFPLKYATKVAAVLITGQTMAMLTP